MYGPQILQQSPGRPRHLRLTPTRHAPSLVDRKSPPEGLESLSFRRSFRCRHKDFMQLIPVSSSCAVTTLSMCIDFEGLTVHVSF